jgi:hypothetical protein
VGPEELVMPSFYLILAALLLISLGLLGVAETFSDSLIGPPTISSTVSDFDADRDVLE